MNQPKGFPFQRGPNKVPLFALLSITVVTILFICVGDVNSLAPVVTTSFLLTYAAVDYSYFVLAMSYDKRQMREDRYQKSHEDQQRRDSAGSNASNGFIHAGLFDIPIIEKFVLHIEVYLKYCSKLLFSENKIRVVLLYLWSYRTIRSYFTSLSTLFLST